MKLHRIASVVLILCAFSTYAIAQEVPIEAVTTKGEKVLLFPNGRWEYADKEKAENQRKAVTSEQKREATSQGGLFGIGRRIYEGDPDYNRGSLNPKLK